MNFPQYYPLRVNLESLVGELQRGEALLGDPCSAVFQGKALVLTGSTRAGLGNVLLGYLRAIVKAVVTSHRLSAQILQLAHEACRLLNCISRCYVYFQDALQA